MSKNSSPKPNFVSNVAIIIIKVLIGLLILVIIGFPIYLMLSADPSPPEIQTVKAEVSRLWVEQIESNTGGSQTRRIEFKQSQGGEFTCNLAPLAISLWGELEVGETYEIAVTWAGTRCYLHEVTRLNKDK